MSRTRNHRRRAVVHAWVFAVDAAAVSAFLAIHHIWQRFTLLEGMSCLNINNPWCLLRECRTTASSSVPSHHSSHERAVSCGGKGDSSDDVVKEFYGDELKPVETQPAPRTSMSTPVASPDHDQVAEGRRSQ